jgi:hypothetical protein
MKNKTKELDRTKVTHMPSRSSSNELIEAGDLGREMGKTYLKEMESMRSSHSRLKGIYYILVYHYQQAIRPTAEYVCFCSMREQPNPQLGCDLWKINNDADKQELIWCLPHRESWKQIYQSVHTDRFLRECMDKFDEGKL